MNREELKEYNKKNVIEKTLECFELYGIEETTMKMIAKKAGLTTRTLQRYFHSKANLTLYVLKIFLKRTYKELNMEFETKKSKTKNGLEQLILWQRMIQKHLKTNFKDMNNINKIELYLIKMGENTSVIKEHTNNVFKIRTGITDAIKRGVADNSIRSDVDEAVADMLLGSHIGLLNRIRVYQEYDNYAGVDLEKKLTDNFEEMIIYYLKA